MGISADRSGGTVVRNMIPYKDIQKLDDILRRMEMPPVTGFGMLTQEEQYFLVHCIRALSQQEVR